MFKNNTQVALKVFPKRSIKVNSYGALFALLLVFAVICLFFAFMQLLFVFEDNWSPWHYDRFTFADTAPNTNFLFWRKPSDQWSIPSHVFWQIRFPKHSLYARVLRIPREETHQGSNNLHLISHRKKSHVKRRRKTKSISYKLCSKFLAWICEKNVSKYSIQTYSFSLQGHVVQILETINTENGESEKYESHRAATRDVYEKRCVSSETLKYSAAYQIGPDIKTLQPVFCMWIPVRYKSWPKRTVRHTRAGRYMFFSYDEKEVLQFFAVQYICGTFNCTANSFTYNVHSILFHNKIARIIRLK